MLKTKDHLIVEGDPLLTRRGAVEYLRGLGVPISFAWYERLALSGRGPPVDGYWGRFPMSRRSRVREWAEARMTRVNEGDV